MRGREATLLVLVARVRGRWTDVEGCLPRGRRRWVMTVIVIKLGLVEQVHVLRVERDARDFDGSARVKGRRIVLSPLKPVLVGRRLLGILVARD